MSERGPSFPSFEPQPTGRDRAIAAMGVFLFAYECGPNAHTHEADIPSVEPADNLPVPPLTADEIDDLFY